MNAKLVSAVVYAVVIACFPAFTESFGITADAGIAPTSMGTVGESLSIGLKLPPFFRLKLEGSRMKYLESAAKMELYGSDVFGDTSRDSLVGSAKLGAVLTWKSFSLNPWAAVSVDNSKSYTIVRLLEPGAGLPQDTSRFMDVASEETVIDLGGGIDMKVAGPHLSFQLSLFLSPTSLWTMDTSRFLSGATWPQEIPAGITTPTLYWSVRDESLDLKAFRYSINGRLRYLPGKGSIALGLIGGYSSLSFGGLSDIVTTSFMPYKQGDGTTPVDELPLLLIKTESTNPARVEFSRNSIEAGVSCEFVFLRDIFKTKGTPAVRLSWIRQSRSYNYRYLDVSETLSAERWEEITDFVKLALSFGLEPF